MNTKKYLKEIFITIFVISLTAIGYAAVSTVSSGATLTATIWNDMKAVVDGNTNAISTSTETYISRSGITTMQVDGTLESVLIEKIQLDMDTNIFDYYIEVTTATSGNSATHYIGGRLLSSTDDSSYSLIKEFTYLETTSSNDWSNMVMTYKITSGFIGNFYIKATGGNYTAGTTFFNYNDNSIMKIIRIAK